MMFFTFYEQHRKKNKLLRCFLMLSRHPTIHYLCAHTYINNIKRYYHENHNSCFGCYSVVLVV